MQLCQSELAVAISIGSTKRQSLALYQSALIKTNSGDFSGAKEDASESQRVAKITGNLYIEACALWVEAISWQWLGNYGHSISLLDRATCLMDLCGMSNGELHTGIRTTQAEIHRLKSQYMDARSIQTYILQDNTADDNPFHHALALLNIVQIDVEIGGTEDDVLRNINTAGALFQNMNYTLGITYCDMFRAALDVKLGKPQAAKSGFQKCLRSSWGKDPDAVNHCLEKLASVQQWSAADQISSPWPVILLVHSVKSKQRLELHKALQFLGDVFQAQEDPETAVSLFTVALDGFIQMDVHCSQAECLVRLGDISKLNGDQLKALDLWQKARPLFERSSQRKQLAHLHEKLASLAQEQLLSFA
jgi:tetratricopeptide (TPR) repeat protein